MPGSENAAPVLKQVFLQAPPHLPKHYVYNEKAVKRSAQLTFLKK